MSTLYYSLEDTAVVFIPVDLTLSSSLDFSKICEQARGIQGKKIVWNLDLDIKNPLQFEGIFNAHYKALQVFSEQVLIPFQDQTFGCSLFEGECDLTSRFPWNKGDYQDFIEWLTDLYGTPERLFEAPLGETPLGGAKSFQELSLEMFDVTPFCRHLKNVHSMNMVAAYLHRLAAALPEELCVFACLDARYVTHPAYLYQLLSKERFSHINLAVKGAQIPLDALKWEDQLVSDHPKEIAVGVCFPNDPYCLQSTLHQLKKVFVQLSEQGISYRIIPEFLMTSLWEGLDDIIFMNQALSPQGKRILQGFAITGGRLIYLDSPVGLENELSYEKFIEKKGSG